MDRATKIYDAGIWLGPITSLLVFGLLTFGISTTLAWLVHLFVLIPTNENFFGQPLLFWFLPTGIGLVFGSLPWIGHEYRVIPNNHVAPLKFLSALLNVHLKTGAHRIPYHPILLSSNRDNVVGDAVKETLEQSASDPGLMFVGDVTVHLDDEDGKSPKMRATAVDNAQVKIRPTFTYRCVSPLQRLGRNRPIKDLNEASRTAVREVTGGLTSARQINMMQGAIARVLSGQRAYFVRTRRSNAAKNVHGGDMVVNTANRRPIFALGNREFDQSLANTLLKKIKEEGDEFMLNQACGKSIDETDADGKVSKRHDFDTIEVHSIHVADKYAAAFRENGYCIVGLPRIGEIEIPEKIINAADQAAAEVEERSAALATAETAVIAADTFVKGGMSKEDAVMVAAAKETPEAVRVLHVTGGNSNGGVILNAN